MEQSGEKLNKREVVGDKQLEFRGSEQAYQSNDYPFDPMYD